MSGAPAETWHKFRFATAPAWAYVFLVLLCTGIGLLPVFILMSVVSRRAGGYLPLTYASRRKLRLVTWAFLGLTLVTVMLWIIATVFEASSSNGSPAAGALFFVGLLTLIVGLIGLLAVRPLIGPRGKVLERQAGDYDNIVELRRLHPAFVTAVIQHQQMQWEQPRPPHESESK